jgi:hypothetical protein
LAVIPILQDERFRQQNPGVCFLPTGSTRTLQYWSCIGTTWFFVALPGSLWLLSKRRKAWVCLLAGVLCWLTPKIPDLVSRLSDIPEAIFALIGISLIGSPILLPLMGAIIVREILSWRD